MTGKEIRLGKLFSGGKNAVVVAVDHGEFDGPIPGMVNLPEVVKKIDPAVSAVLLSPGMLAHCGHAFSYKGAPMAMVRLNWSSHFCFDWDYREGIAVPAMSAADAAAAGAEIALICLTLKTGSEGQDASNVEVWCDLAAEAREVGLPIVGEYFPARPDRLSPEALHDEVLKGCRILAELGADLVKTYYTIKFKDVVAGCPIPILGLGAEKTPKQIQALELAERIINDGGRGVVFGRNAIQVKDPGAFQRALCDVVREGVPAKEAVSSHRLVD
jgi:DhnA family fructose-bisphosphate aldolase class Ia